MNVMTNPLNLDLYGQMNAMAIIFGILLLIQFILIISMSSRLKRKATIKALDDTDSYLRARWEKLFESFKDLDEEMIKQGRRMFGMSKDIISIKNNIQSAVYEVDNIVDYKTNDKHGSGKITSIVDMVDDVMPAYNVDNGSEIIQVKHSEITAWYVET